MKTFVKEITWLNRSYSDFGWGNGYVLIEEGHQLHGLNYNEIMELVQVNEELTFSDLVTEEMVERWPELKKEDIGMWCVGWDSAHYNQNLSNYPKSRVEYETEELKNILLEYNP